MKIMRLSLLAGVCLPHIPASSKGLWPKLEKYPARLPIPRLLGGAGQSETEGGPGSGAEARLAMLSCLLCAQVPRTPHRAPIQCSSWSLSSVSLTLPLPESVPASPQNLPVPLASALPALKYDTTNRRKGGSKTHWVVETVVGTAL